MAPWLALLLSIHHIDRSHLLAQTLARDGASAEELNRLEDEAIHQVETGNEGSGIAVLKSVLARMESAFGSDDPSLYRGLDACAKFYEAKGSPAEAVVFRLKAQAILERVKGPSNSDIASGLNDLGMLYTATKEYVRAETEYGHALAIPNLSPIDHLKALAGLGNLYQESGNQSAASQTFRNLLQYASSAFGEQHTNVGVANLMFSKHLSRVGDTRSALPYAIRSVEILRKSAGPDQSSLVEALSNLANVQVRLGQFRDAESSSREALGLCKRGNGKNTTVYSLTADMLGQILRLEGKLEEAEKLSLEVIAINEKAEGSGQLVLAQSIEHLASIYDDSYDLPRAESCYRRALAIYEKTNNPPPIFVGRLLSGLANVVSERGDYRQAIPLFELSISILAKAYGGHSLAVIDNYAMLSASAVRAGDQDRAKQALATALDLTRSIRDLPDEKTAGMFILLAKASLMQNDINAAKELFARAERAVKLSPDAPIALRWPPLMGLASIDVANGHIEEAEQLALEAEHLIEREYSPNHRALVSPLLCLTFTELAQRHTDAAITAISRAIDIEELNLNRILAVGFEAQKTAFMSTLKVTTDTAVALNIDSLPNNPRAVTVALDTVLRRKGRVLEEVARRSRFIRDQLEPQDRHLIDDLNIARAQFATLVFRSADDAPWATLQDILHKKEAELQQLEAAVLARSPAYAMQVEPASAERVCMLLPPDAALVEFIRYQPSSWSPDKPTSPKYAAYILRRTGRPIGVPLGQAARIENTVSLLREALRNPKRIDVNAISRSLDEMIMRPVRAFIGPSKHILISPDGALNLIPFEALVDESGKYLIESYALTYLTSGRDLLAPPGYASSREDPVIIANPDFDLRSVPKIEVEGAASSVFRHMNYLPLPATAGEANGIAEALGRASVKMGPDATEQAVKRLKGPEILHIATHGFFLNDTQRPDSSSRLLALESVEPKAPMIGNSLLRSGLVLAGVKQGVSGSGEDGVLTALEVSGLDLVGTKLVVLSACDTGVGDIGQWEGIYGLRRALVMAGAESEVISLWPVSDTATRDLMVDFYRRLKGGEGRSDALRQAQLAILHGPARRHPFYWAAFILSGDWEEIKWTDKVN